MTLYSPLWMQEPDYEADLDRLVLDLLVSEGVVNPADGALRVSQRAEGANFSVDVAAGQVAVRGTDVPDQRIYVCWSDARVNLAVTAPPAGTGAHRLDTVAAQVRDGSIVGGVNNDWRLVVFPGAVQADPNVVATAPTLPASCEPLADIDIRNGDASVADPRVGNRQRAASSPLGMPRGMICMWSGSLATVPGGWLICDGLNGTPDLRNRFVLGASTVVPVRSPGLTGGSDAVSLSVAHLPTHFHTGATATQNANHYHGTGTGGGHDHPIPVDNTPSSVAIGGDDPIAERSGGGGNTNRLVSTFASGTHGHGNTGGISANHAHGFTTSAAGANVAHPNMPPWFALAYVMKS